MKKVKPNLTRLFVCIFFIHFYSHALCQTKNKVSSFDEIYLHTDRNIYAPGDDVWFKAYILDDEYHIPSDLSQILYVYLVNLNGDNIINEKFPVEKGLAYGDIQIPDTIRRGEYKIIAFTENMINIDPSFWFNSIVTIDPAPVNLWGINFYPELQKLSENILSGELICNSSVGFPISNVKINYSIEANNKVLFKKSIKTDSLGKAIINWDINPDHINNSLILKIKANYLNKNKSLTINIPKSNGINLKFFPESGNLIQGITNQVAFKITDNYGNPLDIKGSLLNQNGEIIKKIKTIHDGMGVFSINPKASESYFVQLDNPKHIDSVYHLPKVSVSGYTLSLIESEKNILTLLVNMTDDLKGNKVKLSVSNGIQYENLFESAIESEKRFSFITSSLPVGIAKLTLLSENIPVAERLVFLNKYKKLNFSIETEKEIYKPREKVELLIKATDFEGNPSPANISLAVAEKSKINTKNNIASYLLLESKLNKIPGDASFYLQENEKADSALNLLLMTHGWRKIKKIEEYSKMVISTENSPGIRGTVLTMKGKPANNAQVQILDTKTWQLITTQTNKSGRFFFPIEDYIVLADSKNLSISASIPNKSKELVISVDPVVNDTVVSKFKQKEDIILAYNLSQKVKIAKKDPTIEYTNFDKTSEFIEEVKITGEKYDPVYNEARKSTYKVYKKDAEELHTNMMTMTPTVTPIGIIAGKFQDHSILELIRPIAPPFEIINGTIVFRGRNSITRKYVTGALFVVDGVPMGSNITNMAWVNPLSVKEVKVITSPGAALKYGSTCKGLIEITMLEGNEEALKHTKIDKKENISIIKGYKINKEFYSPDYSLEISGEEKTFDSRSTLYWNPNLIIDSSGEQKVTFFNGDKRTFFQCTVIGINESGLMGSSRTTLRVN